MFISQLPFCQWPAIPNDAGAQALSLQFQLERSQWLAPEALQQLQFAQLQLVLASAFEHIPYWRTTLEQAGFNPATSINPDIFARLPALERGDIQTLGERLFNRQLNQSHGKIAPGHTSGSTGSPVQFYRTDLTKHFWRALALREHLWQHRNFSGKLAAIRSNVENGAAPNWGSATENILRTGPACTLNIRADIQAQLDWLISENPDYLLTHPSNLHALARLAVERGIQLPGLKQLRTFGETLHADTVKLCRQAWNVGIADVYSSEEAGYIASQCERGSYHVQAENLLVEIIDEAGNACAPGTIGRVVITTLHNFAMPLIRYEIGDYAEAGTACACGRGLPVLQRILGRRRNMIRLPDGSQHWPSFPEERWVGVAPIRQVQVVQKALDHVVLRVCATRALSAEERAKLIAIFQDTLRFPHRITIEEIDAIPRTPNAKFEDFVSIIA